MSLVGAEGRSFKAITLDDLSTLAKIALNDRIGFFWKHPNWAEYYEDRVICIALCQGAAMHYVDGKTGINDFDVYTFYRSNPKKHWYSKRKKYYDFGNAKFGKSMDKPNFIGRRVDCLSREIDVIDKEDVFTALHRYLNGGKTQTARLLAEKAVVLLEPNCGEAVWPQFVKVRI